MKKKLALALVFVMGLSFTACGKTTVSDSTNEAVSGGVQSTDTNEDKESSGKSDKTTITFINGFTGGDGEYMTKIVDQKKNDAVNVCIVDGGINHVNYYGQNMAMKTPILSYFPQHSLEEKAEEEWTVYGSLCTVSDILLKKLPLTDARVGDYLVFHNIGAYSVTEGIYLFLSRKMPKIYLYSEDGGAVKLRDGLETWMLNTCR